MELIDILKKYNQQGNTIIVVTHDHSFFENLKGEKIILEKSEMFSKEVENISGYKLENSGEIIIPFENN